MCVILVDIHVFCNLMYARNVIIDIRDMRDIRDIDYKINTNAIHASVLILLEYYTSSYIFRGYILQ